MGNATYSRIIALILLIIAAFISAPYGFYQLLRIFTCCVASYLAYQAIIKDIKFIAWGAALLAIIFNPLLPLHFAKEQWAILNFMGALFLGATLLPGCRNRL